MSAGFDKEFSKLKKRNPAHDIIPVIEELGECALSMMYIDIALQDEVAIPTSEDQIRIYYKQNDKLYSQRAVLSNKLHQCDSDNQRMEISIAIGSIQAEIIRVRQIIDEYKQSGTLPKRTKAINKVMDGRRKEKKLQSVCSSISYYKGVDQKRVGP